MFRILIVDDEVINRTMLVQMLNDTGYVHCIEAEDGEQALALAGQYPPDLVLLDVVMPGMSGLDVAPKLKALSPDCYLPILFITALDDQESLVACLAAGGDDFVSKPFDRLILTAKIKAHERSRRMGLELAEKNQSLRLVQQDVERNHRIVEHIFANALDSSDTLNDYFNYYIQPETQFNGDVLLCEKSPSGGVYLFVGDFTGHGLASAIGAIPVSQAFVRMAEKGLSVSEIAIRLNRILLSFLPADMFCVAAIIEIDSSGTRFSIWNGGLPRIVLSDAMGKIQHRLDSRHMPLGVLSDNEFEHDVDIVEANEDDMLLVYTDGLMETLHPEQGLLGEEGVEQWFSEGGINSARQFVELAKAYRLGQAAKDDMTIVLFRCEPFMFDNHVARTHTALLPFELKFTLGKAHLQSHNVVDTFIQRLGHVEGLESARSELYTVVTELVNNAIDHGVLQLSSSLKKDPDAFESYYAERSARIEALEQGEVSVSMHCDPDLRLLTIKVSDSGAGYDVSQIAPSDDEDTFGRGLQLVQAICESVQVTDSGRCTVATMAF